MKLRTLILVLTILAASQAHAQTERFLGSAIHVTLGIKQVNADSRVAPGASVPMVASSLGGGSSWNINRLVLGGEFYFSAATKSSGSILSRYNGFNSNLYTGYQLIKTKGWQFAPLVGFGISRNQIQISSTEGVYTLHAFQNSGYIIHTALRLEKVSSKGNYIGLKLGYNISANGKRPWLRSGSAESIGVSDQTVGFLLQLNLGGLTKLKRYH